MNEFGWAYIAFSLTVFILAAIIEVRNYRRLNELVNRTPKTTYNPTNESSASTNSIK